MMDKVQNEAPAGDYVGGGADDAGAEDNDADELPMNSGGTPAGHADCVPTGGAWPSVQA